MGSRHGLSLGISSLGNGKRPLVAAFFFFYSISSEYQIERRNWPKYFEGIRV
jgi:hypothetical protein